MNECNIELKDIYKWIGNRFVIKFHRELKRHMYIFQINLKCKHF